MITVAFGTNDIISGPYGGSGHATAAEIEDAVRTITKKCTDSGVQTIVWNSPPFDLSAELEPIRTEYNATAASIAAEIWLKSAIMEVGFLCASSCAKGTK